MEGFCKCCLIKYENPVELLEYTEKNRRLYVYLTGLQVKRNDPFPFQLCKGCYMNMKLACRFKKQCRTSDKTIKLFWFKKEAGDTTDFCTYLKNHDDSSLFKFPNINGNGSIPQQNARGADTESMSTSIRNFMKDIIPPDEIADTEARIIREVIEEEADVLDESLDSHWLQDDVSIDTDFNLGFSYSPFSTPRAENNERYYTPQKTLDQAQNVLIPKEENDQNLVQNDVVIENIDPLKEEDDPIMDVEDFIAAKRLLLRPANVSENSENQRAVESILKPGKPFFNYNHDELGNITTVQSILDPNNSKSHLEADSEEYQRGEPNSQVILNGKDISILEKALRKTDGAEFFSLDSILSSPRSKASTAAKPNDCAASAKSTCTNVIHDGECLPCVHVVVTDIKNKKNVASSPNQDQPALSIASKEIDLAIKSKKEVFATPRHQYAIDTPVYKGTAGPPTPTIENILFGKRLDEENINKPKTTSVIETFIENTSDQPVDILEAFFNPETGSCIGYQKIEKETKKTGQLLVELKNKKPEKAKYDLSDFSCKICDVRYKSEKALKIHFAKNHYKISGPKTEELLADCICEYCARCFDKMSKLRTHRSRCRENPKNQNKPELTCEYCLQKFSMESKLKMHQVTHLGKAALKPKDKKYVCQTCGHACASKGNLNTHMRRHNRLYSYICNECTKGFYRRADLEVHMRVHTGELPFSCHMCKKKFRRRDTLTRHVTQHIKDKDSYGCNYCGIQCKTVAGLKKHQKSSDTCLLMREYAAKTRKNNSSDNKLKEPLNSGTEAGKDTHKKENNTINKENNINRENDVHTENDTQFLETDTQYPETDSQYPETDNQYPETDSQYPETDTQRTETDTHTECIQISDLIDVPEVEDDIYTNYEVLEDVNENEAYGVIDSLDY